MEKILNCTKKLWFCQEGILRVQRYIARKNLLEETELFLTFGLWMRIFRVCGKRKLTDLPKLHSVFPELHFQKKDFFRKKHNSDSIFWVWVKKFRNWPNVFAKGVKTKIYVTIKAFHKMFSWEIDTNLYLFMASLRKIWNGRKLQTCQKGILGVQRNILGNKFPEEAKLFLTFGLWTRNFKVSGKTKMTELSKLHSMCPEIQFQKKDFFWKKKHNFDFTFWRWVKKCRNLPNVFAKGVETKIYMTKKNILEKVFFGKNVQVYIFSWLLWGKFDLQENSKFVRKAF